MSHRSREITQKRRKTHTKQIPQVRISFISNSTMPLTCIIALTEATVRKELAEEKQHRAVAGVLSPHETMASGFIFLGIELEDMQ